MNIALAEINAGNLDYAAGLDVHIGRDMLERAAKDGRCFVITADGAPAGVLRFGFFWDSIPFLNLILLEERFQRCGIGSKAMALWEDMMRTRGYGMVMTSTQSDEHAQHFYRALGYRDAGCLLLEHPGYEQPSELFFTKGL